MKPRNKTTRRIRQLIGGAVLALLAFCSMVFYQDNLAYRQTVSQGQKDATRLDGILADYVKLTFLDVNLALWRAIDQQHLNGLFGGNLPQYMEENFRAWLGETQQIAALALVDAKGGVRVEAHKEAYADWLDASKEALLNRMRDAEERYVFIGVGQRAGNPPLILMSQRVSAVNGDFDGIVVAAIDPQYFMDFYASVTPGAQKFMSLSFADGTVLAETPGASGTDRYLVQGMIKQYGERVEQAPHVLVNIIDGKLKISAIKKLHNLPVLAGVVLSEEDILDDWERNRTKEFSTVLMFTVFVVAAAWFAIALTRQIERAEESERGAMLASQAKSEFLANMSHELRTPLNAIIGFSEMLNTGYFGPLTGKQKERIGDIHLCGSHLLQLISDILEFSKWEAGRLELSEEAVDMPHIIDECARIMGSKIKAKNIHFVQSSEPGMPMLWADKRKVRQVLLNLLSNALKFTPEGGTVRVICLLDTNGAVNLIVSDNGIGIPEADIPQALAVFGQVHRSRSNEGTGLGLPLCRMYAELHGGKLVLTSKEKEGTTVRIIFPKQRTLQDRRGR